MSRHRNVRKLDYSEEEYSCDEVYERSLDDEVAISPNTAEEFMYHRESRENPSLNSYIDTREQSEDTRTKQLTSPLASNSRTADPPCMNPGDIGPPPGFLPISRNTASSQGSAKKISAGSLKKISSSAAPKLGFDLSSVIEEEGRYSGTPSPSLSPYHTPVRTPSPPLADHSSGSKLTIPKLKSKQQKIDVITEFHQREKSSKDKVNLVVIGHVDAGKSTLMGHLLYLMGNVSKKLMHKYEQESQKVGKGSFAFAWVLDETGEERHRGITMDVAQQVFETESKIINLLDAPGHKDFIPNMITGAAQADVAVLVINATTGEFEAGFEAGGQTREHAMLVRSLGVKQLAVAINKMDTVKWSEARFNEIVQKLKIFLKQAGYKESDVRYVPCSGLAGENLASPSTIDVFNNWYSGVTLLEVIDQFSPPSRPVERPFRCCVGDIFKGLGSGFNVSGRIDSGHVQVGESVLILPAQEIATIKSISTSEDSEPWVAAGDQAIFNIAGVDMSNISVGSILCSIQIPVKVATKFEARIIVFNIDIPITVGFPVIIHYQSLNEPAVIKKLISLLNRNSGELVRKNPRCLSKNCTAVVQIRVPRPLCIELYRECKELGRFMIRSSGHTIAAGVVTKILC